MYDCGVVTCSQRHISIAMSFWAAAILCADCGRNPLRARSSDAGQGGSIARDAALGREVATQTRDAGVPDAAQDWAAQDAPLGADVVGGKDSAARADACVPLTCHDPKCDPYCGTIGDGCGGTLNCGDDCPPGWTCEEGICRGAPAICAGLSCTTPYNYSYCGRIGDGCGRALDCGNCTTPGWQCVDSLCVGSRDACTPISSCDAWSGERYCGLFGDGCGDALECGDCPVGWTCVNSMCADNTSGWCRKVSCAPLGGGRYCGVIGDGCGSLLECGETCLDGGTCGQTRANVCGDSTMPDPPPLPPPTSPPPPPPPAPCPAPPPPR
jgi:hypothetical protein